MPPKTLKDLYTDKDYNVPIIEKPSKPENIVNSELNKNRPLLQFGKNLPKIYGSDLVRIESRGSIDPARTLAVKSSRYVSVKGNGGGFGRLLSNLLGQQGAYRPSDTIFPANQKNEGIATAAPVSKNGQPVNGDWSELKYAVEENVNYVVSDHPNKPSELDKGLNGLLKGNSAKEIAQQAVGKAIGAAQDLITKGLTSALTSKRKNKNRITEEEKKIEKFSNIIGPDGRAFVGSEYFKTHGAKSGNPNLEEELTQRDGSKIRSFDYIRDNYLLKSGLSNEDLLKLAADNLRTQTAYLKIKQIGFENVLIFPAAISGVTEQINPEWDTFKYIGSPFNNYRYRGVNRKISFGLQVYHLGEKKTNLTTQGQEMKLKLNKLRELAFPFNQLNKITYNKGDVSGLTFVPNLIELSLGDYYTNLNGFIDNMTIGIPDNISWANNDPNLQGNGFVYPTIVNVQFSMTIVENHIINKSDNTIAYRFTDIIEKSPAAAGAKANETNELEKRKQDFIKSQENWNKSRSLSDTTNNSPKLESPKTYKVGGKFVTEEEFTAILKRDNRVRKF